MINQFSADEQGDDLRIATTISHAWTGNWSGIIGTIPNGFDVNPQFQITVKPTRAADGPWLYTDEDWGPHAGGWISGLTHLRMTKRYRDAGR